MSDFQGVFSGVLGVGEEICPTPKSAPWVYGRVLGYLIPNTQNRHKYPLKIKHLQAQGVGGVEGVGHSVCMATIYTRERFVP